MRARRQDRKVEDRTRDRRAAVARAHGPRPLPCEPRVTGHESQASAGGPRVTGHESSLSNDERRVTNDAGPARSPCCANCVHAAPLLDGSRQLLACTNCPLRPRRMRVTDPSHCCPLFRARRPRKDKTAPPEPPDSSIRYLPLTQGKYAVVDAADYERAMPFSWHASKAGSRTYARCNLGGRNVALHRFLTNAPQGMVVDHIDHDGLNNRQSNLRICTQQQNLYNSRPKGKSSRFKGVCWDKAKKRWVVYIRYGGRTRFVGQFTDEIEAAKAYDREAAAMFGEYAYLNFPPGAAHA